MRLSSFAVTFALCSASLAARADSFNFTFGNPSSSFSGSGVLTTGILEAPGEYPIVNVTGIAATAPNVAGLAINSLLAAGTFPTIANGGTFPANDNVLFVTNGVGNLDGYGLAFSLSNGAQINIYNPSGSAFDALLERANGTVLFADLPITITAAAPEPSSFLLIGTGLLSVAGALKRRLS